MDILLLLLGLFTFASCMCIPFGPSSSWASGYQTVQPWYTDRPIEFSIRRLKIVHGLQKVLPLPNKTRESIYKVLQHFSERTCLRFKEAEYKTAFHPDIIKALLNKQILNYTLDIISSDSIEQCQSRQVGMIKNYPIGSIYDSQSNGILLGHGCNSFLTIAHEFGHVLGLFHTQQRSDRDNYVEISRDLLWGLKGKGFQNYKKAKTSDLVPFDFFSMMLYSDVKTKDNLRQFMIGNQQGVAQSDLLLINKLYKCFDNCKSKIQCFNGGFQNPNKCSECVCPRGFESRFCESREESFYEDKPCGATLEAEDEWQTLRSLTMKSVLQHPVVYPTSMCHWHLKAQLGYKLEIVFKKLWDCKSLPVKDSCAFGGTDIKLGDFGTGGYRFCCNGQIPEGHVFRTTGSLAYVGLEAVFWFHSFELEFRRVLA